MSTVCEICTDTVAAADVWPRPCDHEYCLACWRSYAKVELEAKDRVTCMNPYCQHELTSSELEHLLGRTVAARCRHVQKNPPLDERTLTWARQHLRLCPWCFVPIEKNGGCNSMRCRNCSHRFSWASAPRFNSETRCRLLSRWAPLRRALYGVARTLAPGGAVVAVLLGLVWVWRNVSTVGSWLLASAWTVAWFAACSAAVDGGVHVLTWSPLLWRAQWSALSTLGAYSLADGARQSGDVPARLRVHARWGFSPARRQLRAALTLASLGHAACGWLSPALATTGVVGLATVAGACMRLGSLRRGPADRCELNSAPVLVRLLVHADEHRAKGRWLGLIAGVGLVVAILALLHEGSAAVAATVTWIVSLHWAVRWVAGVAESLNAACLVWVLLCAFGKHVMVSIAGAIVAVLAYVVRGTAQGLRRFLCSVRGRSWRSESSRARTVQLVHRQRARAPK